MMTLADLEAQYRRRHAVAWLQFIQTQVPLDQLTEPVASTLARDYDCALDQLEALGHNVDRFRLPPDATGAAVAARLWGLLTCVAGRDVYPLEPSTAGKAAATLPSKVTGIGSAVPPVERAPPAR